MGKILYRPLHFSDQVSKLVRINGLKYNRKVPNNRRVFCRNLLSGVLGASISQDGSPFGLHYIMFMPVFMSQADEEQQAKWLHRAMNCGIIGSYAQV